MRRTIEETERRRAKQITYNIEHNITPTTILKSTEDIFKHNIGQGARKDDPQPYIEPQDRISLGMVADPVVHLMSKQQLEKAIVNAKKKMLQAAKDMDFLEAARLRDEMYALEKIIESRVE